MVLGTESVHSMSIIGSLNSSINEAHREHRHSQSQQQQRSNFAQQLKIVLPSAVVPGIETENRMHVADAPHERRPPNLFRRYNLKERKPTEDGAESSAELESGHTLDKIV